MSPKELAPLMQDMDVEISNAARGSADLMPAPPVTYGQDLVHASSEIVAETPEKSRLRQQVSDLVDALQCEENKVHMEIHEVKTDAGQKVRELYYKTSRTASNE